MTVLDLTASAVRMTVGFGVDALGFGVNTIGGVITDRNNNNNVITEDDNNNNNNMKDDDDTLTISSSSGGSYNSNRLVVLENNDTSSNKEQPQELQFIIKDEDKHTNNELDLYEELDIMLNLSTLIDPIVELRRIARKRLEHLKLREGLLSSSSVLSPLTDDDLRILNEERLRSKRLGTEILKLIALMKNRRIMEETKEKKKKEELKQKREEDWRQKREEKDLHKKEEDKEEKDNGEEEEEEQSDTLLERFPSPNEKEANDTTTNNNSSSKLGNKFRNILSNTTTRTTKDDEHKYSQAAALVVTPGEEEDSEEETPEDHHHPHHNRPRSNSKLGNQLLKILSLEKTTEGGGGERILTRSKNSTKKLGDQISKLGDQFLKGIITPIKKKENSTTNDNENDNNIDNDEKDQSENGQQEQERSNVNTTSTKFGDQFMRRLSLTTPETPRFPIIQDITNEEHTTVGSDDTDEEEEEDLSSTTRSNTTKFGDRILRRLSLTTPETPRFPIIKDNTTTTNNEEHTVTSSESNHSGSSSSSSSKFGDPLTRVDETTIPNKVDPNTYLLGNHFLKRMTSFRTSTKELMTPKQEQSTPPPPTTTTSVAMTTMTSLLEELETKYAHSQYQLEKKIMPQLSITSSNDVTLLGHQLDLLELPKTFPDMKHDFVRNEDALFYLQEKRNSSALESLLERDKKKKTPNSILYYVDDATTNQKEHHFVYAIIINEQLKCIIVVFRASANNWMKDIQTGMTPFTISSSTTNNQQFTTNSQQQQSSQDSYVNYGNVHTGFYQYLFGKHGDESTTSKADDIMKQLHTLFGQHRYQDFTLYFTGHGVGGALSTLMGFRASSSLKNNIIPFPIRIVSFASPYVGDQTFRNAFEGEERQRRLLHLRVTNEDDVTPLLPLFAANQLQQRYKHVGMNMKLYWTTERFFRSKLYRFTYPKPGDIWNEVERAIGNNLLLGTTFDRSHHCCTEYRSRLDQTDLKEEEEKKTKKQRLHLSDLYNDTNIVGNLFVSPLDNEYYNFGPDIPE